MATAKLRQGGTSNNRRVSFRDGDYCHEDKNPDRGSHPERCLCDPVDDPRGEICQPEPLRIVAERADDVPVPGRDDEGEHGHSCPPQVQENLEVTVVSLVQTPGKLPECLESIPEPEALEAGPK